MCCVCACGPLKVTKSPFNLETPQSLCHDYHKYSYFVTFSFTGEAKKKYSIYLFIAKKASLGGSTDC